MSYCGYAFRVADRAAFFAAECAALVAMGWVLHDNVSATVKVYKSNGENSDQPYGYIWIDNNASGYIDHIAYQYWDAAAHTGTRKHATSGTSTRMNAFNSSYECVIAGSKDMVTAVSYIFGSNYTSNVSFGHIPKKMFTPLTTTTDAISTGSNVSIPVSSSAGFTVGNYVQIVGVSEGCDRLQITAIPDVSHIQVASLPRNYTSGAFIGSPASVFFGHNSVSNQVTPCSYWTDAALTVSGSTYSIHTTAQIPDNVSFNNKVVLSPLCFSGAGGLIGFIDENYLSRYNFTAANFDCFILNTDGSVPVTSTATNGSNNTIGDIAKSWEVDALINKWIVLTGGTGVSQARKITDNDGTSLTVDSNWFTNPDATTTYIICDTVYRYLQYITGYTGAAARLTSTVTPA
jgi:hypothetical protein